jgi:transposase InsO family protein
MLISLLTEKNKHEQFKFFKKFKAIYEKQHETKIKELRSDNGLEYFSSEFQEFLRREGIVHKTSVAYVPQSNGKAERFWIYNRTTRKMFRSRDVRFYHLYLISQITLEKVKNASEDKW